MQASGGAGVQALGTAEKDLNAYFASEDKNEDAGTAFLKQFLQQRLWAQDGDDAGKLLSCCKVAQDTTCLQLHLHILLPGLLARELGAPV